MQGAGRADAQARQIERDEKKAETAFAQGRKERAKELGNKAEGIKKNLQDRGVIKKDASTEFKKALNEAEVLKDIKKATQDTAKKIGVNL